MNEFTYIFLALLTLTCALRWWLATRQLRHVVARRGRVPAAFAGHIDTSAHQRAADYTVARVRLGRHELGFEAALLLIWTLGGGLQALDTAWRALELGPVVTGVAVLASASLISALLDIPWAAYRCFGIEQRFGFNRMTPRLFVTDLLRGALLSALLGLPLLAAVLGLMQAAGGLWWLYAWALWMAFSLTLTWAWPRWLAPLFNRFSPLEDAALRERIHALLERCGFRSEGVFVMDGSRRSSHGNAYFTGVGASKRIVFFDTLLNSLDARQIEAVLAHELGHFRLHHVRWRLFTVASTSLAALAALGALADQPGFYTGLGVELPSAHAALMLFGLCAPLAGTLLKPLMARLSRHQEFQADAYAARHADAGALIEALATLYRDNAATLTPDPLYSAFHDSHPPAALRIAHLQSLQRAAP